RRGDRCARRVRHIRPAHPALPAPVSGHDLAPARPGLKPGSERRLLVRDVRIRLVLSQWQRVAGRVLVVAPLHVHMGSGREEVSDAQTLPRSEERRVGKECRTRWSADYEKKDIIKESTDTKMSKA